MPHKEFLLFLKYPIKRVKERYECTDCIFRCIENPGCKLEVWRKKRMRLSERKRYPNMQTHPCVEHGKKYIFVFVNPKT